MAEPELRRETRAGAVNALRRGDPAVHLLPVFRAVLIQRGNQQFRRGWNGNRAVKYNVLGIYLFAVDSLVGVIVRPERGTVERDSREQAARPRIRQDLRRAW